VLCAFQVGDEPLHLTDALGHAISLDFHRLQPDRVAELLGQGMFTGNGIHAKVTLRVKNAPLAR